MWRGFYDNRAVLAQTLPLEIFWMDVCTCVHMTKIYKNNSTEFVYGCQILISQYFDITQASPHDRIKAESVLLESLFANKT